MEITVIIPNKEWHRRLTEMMQELKIKDIRTEFWRVIFTWWVYKLLLDIFIRKYEGIREPAHRLATYLKNRIPIPLVCIACMMKWWEPPNRCTWEEQNKMVCNLKKYCELLNQLLDWSKGKRPKGETIRKFLCKNCPYLEGNEP